MKILMLADTLDIGGAETHIYELSRSLLAFGHEIKIFSGGGKTAELLERAGIEVVKTDALTMLPRSFPRALGELLSLLRSFKPHIVHAHTRRGLFLCDAAKRIIPFPLVFTAHAKFSAKGAKRIFTKPPCHTVAVSEDIKRHFINEFGADGNSVAVIENGIDTERFTAEKPTLGSLRILNVSRLDRDCSAAAELLCRIASRLSLVLPLSQIVIAGGGSDFERINAMANAANRAVGRELIRCVGAQTDVLPLLCDCNLFVGVSRAALEAMCCNRAAVICGSEGYFGLCGEGNFELAARENFCGRGYARPSAERLFSDICEFFRNADRADLYLRERVKEKYGVRRMTNGVLEVYRSAAEGHSRAQKNDVVLCGYYGFGNLGDELVRSCILEDLGDLRVSVIGASGEGRISRFDLPKICAAIRDSSVFVLGGGSLLQNSTSRRSLWYYLTLLKIADLFGRRVMLYANGIGPINGAGALQACRRALRRADVASVRDRVSLEALDRILPEGTPRYLSCDPVLLVSPCQKVRPRVAIFIRGEDCDGRLISALKGALLEFRRRVSEELEIVFASMNQKSDERSARLLADTMPFPSRCEFFRERKALSKFVASSELVVSCRLHALIVAASASRPFVALCHDPKLEAFVKECELPDILAPSIADEALEEKIFKALEYAVRHSSDLSAHISAVTAAIRPRADRDREEVMRLASVKSTGDGETGEALLF